MYSVSLISFVCHALVVLGNPLKDSRLQSNPHRGQTINPATGAATDKRNDIIVATYEAGGQHGDDQFDDSGLVGNNHYRIGAIKMWCNRPSGQLQALSFWYRDITPSKTLVAYSGKVIHGTNRVAEWENTWTLDLDEYIQTIDVWTYKARGHTRIGTLSMSTNKRKDYAMCGPKSGTKTTWGDKDKALSYVSGSSGRVVDFLQGHFIANTAY